MRVSVALLALSLLGAVGGAWLVGRWAVGVVLVVYSAGLGAYAVLRDIPEPVVEARAGMIEAVLERARRAS